RGTGENAHFQYDPSRFGKAYIGVCPTDERLSGADPARIHPAPTVAPRICQRFKDDEVPAAAFVDVPAPILEAFLYRNHRTFRHNVSSFHVGPVAVVDGNAIEVRLTNAQSASILDDVDSHPAPHQAVQGSGVVRFFD